MNISQPILNKTQLEAFIQEGFTILPNAVPPVLLQKLDFCLKKR